jgi:hypothetical protein
VEVELFTRSWAALCAAVATRFPAAFSDPDALRIATGRRAPTDAERAALGDLDGTLPLVLG